MGNEDIYRYQFESMLQQAKEVLGKPTLFYSDDEDENEIDAECKAVKYLFDVSGPDFSRFKVFESEYRYWVEVYIIKIIEKLLERSNYQYEEKYFGDGNEQFALNLTLEGKRVAAYFLFSLSYQEGDRTDYDKIGEALTEKSDNVDEIRLYLFQDHISEFSLASLVNHNVEMNKNGFVKALTLQDFFCELWGQEEYSTFIEYAEEYVSKVNRIVGYKTVITPTKNTFRVFKTLKAKMLQDLNYRAIADKGELGALQERDFERINKNFISNKMYNVLISSNDFADSFLSAEWSYDVYRNAMGELELTGIISGYLKSIEQLLFKIAKFHRGEGLRIKTKDGYQPYSSTNEEIIDSTVGSLKSFVFSYDAKLAISGNIRQFIKDAVELWTKYQRNGYFHKHNLFQKDNKIDEVREQTLYLYFLILGGLFYTPDQQVELGANPLESDGSSPSFIDVHYSGFKTWFESMIDYDLPSEVPGLWMMLIPEDGYWTIKTFLMKYFYIDDFESSQGHDLDAIDTNHIRSIPVFKWEDENADYEHFNSGSDQFRELFDRYKAYEKNKLNQVNAILLSYGRDTQLVHFKEK